MDAISSAARAERVWTKIQRKPASVIFAVPRRVSGDGTVTPASALAAQTVRIVLDNRPTQIVGTAGTAPRFQATVYGVRDHPDPAIADTDMEEGYEFNLDGDHYRCVNVKLVSGGKQGTFVVNG